MLSNEWKDRFCQIVDQSKIAIIPNFVSIKSSDIKRVEHSGFVVLYIGEFSERKGCFNIPQIISKLEQIQDTKVFVAGFGQTQKMDQKIAEYNMQNVITNLGYLNYEQKVKILSQTDVLLFPSCHEGVPMVLLEAMSFGIPCVTTNVGGIPSIINTKLQTGITYNPDDFDEMAKELDRLQKDKAYYQTISHNCKKLAEEYTIDKSVDNVLVLYDKILLTNK